MRFDSSVFKTFINNYLKFIKIILGKQTCKHFHFFVLVGNNTFIQKCRTYQPHAMSKQLLVLYAQTLRTNGGHLTALL